MTDTNFDLSPDTIKELFANGKCLTFTPFMQTLDTWLYMKNKKYEFEKQTGKKAVIKSKTALMPQESFNKNFHFFSNGVLILSTMSQKEINNIKRAIKLNGFEIKEVYQPQNETECMHYNTFLHKISDIASTYYPYQEDLLIEPLPDIKVFVQNLFANDNECLTASKNENLDPMYRDYMAIFANGRVLLSEEKTNNQNIFGTLNHYNFKEDNPHYVLSQYEYIPHAYIEAIYQKAKEYNWYISKKDVQELRPKQNIPEEDIDKMNLYIDNLLKNRTCISITIPSEGSEITTSPDKEKYVLFSDGTLIYSKTYSPKVFLQKCFTNLTFKEEKVPEYYIEQIYKRLLNLQKSANTIFSEMLKQKAKKIKKLFEIPHYQALEAVAKIAGLSNWEQISKLTEQESRRGIFIEQNKKKLHQNQNMDDVLKKEYHKFYIAENK